jgi:hypothetical protein
MNLRTNTIVWQQHWANTCYGKQYVVAYSAGNLFAGSAKGDSVWLFALDGTLEPVAPQR